MTSVKRVVDYNVKARVNSKPGWCDQRERVNSSSISESVSLAMSNNYSFAGRSPESQEFSAARLLIDSGFLPTELRGVVKNIRTGHVLGRTLGSVWRAMYIVLEGRDPEDAALAAGSISQSSLSNGGSHIR